MPISLKQLPLLTTPPQKTDPANFDQRADDFLSALPGWGNTFNENAVELNKITSGLDQASPIAAWESLETYNFPDVVAGSDGYSYRCIGTGVQGVDPVTDDGSVWIPVSVKPSDLNAVIEDVNQFLGEFVAVKNIQAFTSSGTYTPTEGAKVAIVEGVGGGASGGGSGSGLNNASGGGAGGYFRRRIPLSGISSVAVTIGSGGASVSGNTNGNNGGTTSFGSYCSATGGTGGRPNSGIPGRGGTSTGGDLDIDGGGGGRAGGGPISGHGGSSFFGGGRSLGGSDGAYGSGGAGAVEGVSNSSAAGIGGIVIVTEY